MSFNSCPTAAGSVTVLRANAIGVPAPERRETTPSLSVRPRPPLSARTDIVQLVDGCERELRAIQSRLGTPAEQADDTLRARELAHKAKNLRFAADLWEQMMARRNLDPRPAA